jgi:SulP family sulfate permease
MLLAAPLASFIPLAALGGVLAIVAWNMAEKNEFAALLRSSWGDASVLLATFLLTIFADLTIAIATGVTLGAFLFLHRMAEAVEIEGGGQLISEDVADTKGAQRSIYDPSALDGDALVYRISGAFFFGATAAVSSVLDRIGEHPKVFVLDFTDVPLVDTTAAKSLEGFVEKLHRSGTSVYFAGARQSVRRTLLSAGLRRPLVCYASTAEDAISQWRLPSEAENGA